MPPLCGSLPALGLQQPQHFWEQRICAVLRWRENSSCHVWKACVLDAQQRKGLD